MLLTGCVHLYFSKNEVSSGELPAVEDFGFVYWVQVR